jgi:hypothetical protein
MAVTLSLYAPAALYLSGIFLVLMSVRGWVHPSALMWLGLGKLKTSNDLIGILTRDRAACSIVPQSTTLQRAPSLHTVFL